jgi:hypothetical protein
MIYSIPLSFIAIIALSMTCLLDSSTFFKLEVPYCEGISQFLGQVQTQTCKEEGIENHQADNNKLNSKNRIALVN